jgi:hypothetical protein
MNGITEVPWNLKLVGMPMAYPIEESPKEYPTFLCLPMRICYKLQKVCDDVSKD